MLTANWITASHRTQPIGLDIGHRSLKMVQVAVHNDRAKVLAARSTPAEVDPARDAQERNHHFVRTIRQMLADGQFRGRNVVSALPADRVGITSLRLPEAETDQADKILRREAADRFDLDPNRDTINYVLAGNVRQGEEVKNEYILFAVDNETIRTHIRMLEEAGLTSVGIDASPCALFRAFERTMRRQEDRERTTIFIDVGHQYTMVVFGRGGEICLVKQIAIGMSQFNEEVASALGIAQSEAESFRLKLQRDELRDPAMRRHVVDALNLVSEQLAGEISLCLRYYTVTFRGKRVDRAVVAGGGAYEQVLLDVLRRHLSVEIEVADPLRGFEYDPARIDRDPRNGSADLTLAVGLSLKGWDSSVLAGGDWMGRSEPALEGRSL